MTKIFNKNEISLFGNLYPVLANVTENLRPPFAPKTVTGDYSKDSMLDVSAMIFSDQRGGLGIKDMDETKDFNRFLWSTCNVDFKGHIILPTKATNCGSPSVDLDDPVLMVEYADELYVVCGVDLYKWIEVTPAWSVSLHTFAVAPTSAVVHDGKLYFACDTDFERFDGSNWTDGDTLSGTAIPSLFLLNWDEKLLILDDTGLLSYSVDEGTTWTANAQSKLDANSFESLFLLVNGSNYVVPFMGTKVGLYELDFDGAEWINTGLTFPPHDYGCKGAAMWRDAAGYIPVGMGIYQFVSGTSVIITPMGLDRDYGLPKEYRGNVIQVLPEHNALYALLNAVTRTDRDFTAGYSWDTVFVDDEGYSAVMKWPGQGWSCARTSIEGEALNCGVISNADGKYRLWFNMGYRIYYVPLNVNLQNPLELLDSDYESYAEHYYPIFDADNSVVDKLLFSVTVKAENTTALRYAMVYYSLDGNSNTWTLLTNTTYPDGKLDIDGEIVFELASGNGIKFNSIQIKAEMYFSKTDDPLAHPPSPDIRWVRLNYIKEPDARWTYGVIVDCTRDYRHKRRSTLVDALKTAADTKILGDFIYRTFEGTNETKKVKVLTMAGVEKGGQLKTGQYKLTLLAP
jgi:hypothetical protein